jgi:hypothetical protein
MGSRNSLYTFFSRASSHVQIFHLNVICFKTMPARRNALRKTARNYLAVVAIAATILWLR